MMHPENGSGASGADTPLARIGRMNRLKVVKKVDFGLYLDGGSKDAGGLGEILLPRRYAPGDCEPGDILEVFIYCDSEDRPVATTERPRVMVGEFACLKVVQVNRTGAFLDWGLPKDLLVPFSEQPRRMQPGRSYVVAVYVDEESGRIAASARLDDFLHDDSRGEFETGEAVDLLIARRTDLGFKAIIENSHWGLLHAADATRPLKPGMRLRGYIKHIREDGRIDLALEKSERDKVEAVADELLGAIKRQGGRLDVSDASPAEEIRERFGISKGLFKKAVGLLYRQRRIRLEPDAMVWKEREEAED